MKRPNAQQYKEERQDLLNKLEKLNQIIVTRLYTLCVSYPEAPLVQQGDTIFKAKALIPMNRSKDYIKDLPFDTLIHYIGAVEKWLEEQHPHKQTKINFDVQNQ
jgi:hypothetical protein